MATAAVVSSGWSTHLTPGHRKGLRALTNGKYGSGELWATDKLPSHHYRKKAHKYKNWLLGAGNCGILLATYSSTDTEISVGETPVF
jgi:hypothetical protein